MIKIPVTSHDTLAKLSVFSTDIDTYVVKNLKNIIQDLFMTSSSYSLINSKIFLKKISKYCSFIILSTSSSFCYAQTFPSLYQVLMAEFALDRNDIPKAVEVYKRQSFFDNSSPVFERALSLSLVYDNLQSSLAFANTWQQQHSEHIPALFYTTHLALKSQNYTMAGKKLNQILEYDQNADLSQILMGIYPDNRQDQQQLLNVLQSMDVKDNPSLLVLFAGLLLQFNEPQTALIKIDKALKKQPNTPAFLILKADILQKLEKPEKVIDFIEKARQAIPDNKGLFMYQVRYLVKLGKGLEAWELLANVNNQKFLADDEIRLLASLIGIDIEVYQQADNLLKPLLNSSSHRDQAYYYLAVSAERQSHVVQAIEYYGKVMEPNLVLEARQKQIHLLTQRYQFDEAIASAVKLRQDFDDFLPESYIIQAKLLNKIKQNKQAIELLDTAEKQLPDNTDILFTKASLLPDNEFAKKNSLMKQLIEKVPDNVEYKLEYARFLVSQKQESDTVTELLSPLQNDTAVGLKARQILSQQALYQKNYQQILSLLSDNFDIFPDVISGLLLRQANLALGYTQEAKRISHILKTELNYEL